MKDVAVLDIGSNSVRLMLRKDDRVFIDLDTTRLGQGVADRTLQPEPVRRTVEALVRFAGLAREQGVENVCAFATSAVRDAKNAEDLLAPVRARCGLEIDILPGEVEAQLAYLGAAQGKRACVLDVGGASTELVAGEGSVKYAVSLQLGAVRLKDGFGQDRAAAQRHMDALYAAQREHFAPYDDAPFYGVGGTLTTLAAMGMRMKTYDRSEVHGYELTQEEVRAWVDKLWDLPVEQRDFDGLRETRRDIIAHGALIVERFMHSFGRKTITVSTGDNLDGYLKWKGLE